MVGEASKEGACTAQFNRVMRTLSISMEEEFERCEFSSDFNHARMGG